MSTPGISFANALAEYAHAIAEGRIDDAIQHAKMIPMYGELIAIHPDFIGRFKRNCPDLDPKQTLHQAGELLRTVAESIKQAKLHAGPDVEQL